MRRKISQSIQAKTFLSMLALLVVCCIIIYGMVMIFLPRNYHTEPVSYTHLLDFDSMAQVAELIRRLSDMGKVIFIVTHDFEFVCRTCSRVLHFDEGEMPDDVPVVMDALPKLRELFSVSDGKERCCLLYTSRCV